MQQLHTIRHLVVGCCRSSFASWVHQPCYELLLALHWTPNVSFSSQPTPMFARGKSIPSRALRFKGGKRAPGADLAGLAPAAHCVVGHGLAQLPPCAHGGHRRPRRVKSAVFQGPVDPLMVTRGPFSMGGIAPCCLFFPWPAPASCTLLGLLL